MILACPQCGSKFEVPDYAIPGTGRMVKCSSCSNKWHAFPAEESKSVESVISSISEDIKLHLDDLSSLVEKTDTSIAEAPAPDSNSNPPIQNDHEEPQNPAAQPNPTPPEEPNPEGHAPEQPRPEEPNEEPKDTISTSKPEGNPETKDFSDLQPSKTPFYESKTLLALTISFFSLSILLLIIALIYSFKLNISTYKSINEFLHSIPLFDDSPLKFESINIKTKLEAHDGIVPDTYKVTINLAIENYGVKESLSDIRLTFFDQRMNYIDEYIIASKQLLAPNDITTIENTLDSIPINTVYMSVDCGNKLDLFFRDVKHLANYK